MKKNLFVFIGLIISACALAQVPQAINYQAVARNAQGLVIPAQNVSVRFSILDGSATGTVVYQETQATTTNNYGLFTLAIGKGVAVTGTFAGINWASGTDKFLKVEIAASGGSTYDLQGTTQLLSVPYAMYSEKTRLIAGNAINITGGNTIAANYTAGSGINITGPVISHAMQAGTGINITGATISGAYQGGNAINITGNTISANYTAGTGINITGSTISHNFIAGTGINITGNVISAPASVNYWQPDASGIYYNAGKVGIGAPGSNPFASNAALTVNGAIDHYSSDTWQTVKRFRNTSSAQEYQFNLAGSANSDMPIGSMGMFNATGLHWIWNTDGTANSYMAVGSTNYVAQRPKSRLHVFAGDINIEQIGSGIIMKSPNGQCWRITIDNTGNLIRTAIACP